MVSGRPSRIRLCTTGKENDGQIEKLIQHYVLEREQMTCLFVLVDSRLAPQKIDMEFIEWLGENGVPFAIIFTKADKQSAGKTRANVGYLSSELPSNGKSFPLISFHRLKRKPDEKKFWTTSNKSIIQ